MILNQEEIAKILGFKPNQTERMAKALINNGHTVNYGRRGRIYIISPDIKQLDLPGNSANEICFDQDSHG